MNRSQRRAEEAREKIRRNNERVISQITEANEAAAAGERMRMLLFAVVRKHGRIVLTPEDLQLGENDRLDMKQEGGRIVLGYAAGTVTA